MPEELFTTRPREVRAGAGRLQSITGARPVAGAQISYQIPNGVEVRVQALRFTLVTDATAVNRQVNLIIDDGATTLLVIEPPAAQGASGTRGYNYGPGFPAWVLLTQEFVAPLPVDLILEAGWWVRTATTNMQAGDQFSAPQLCLEEWLAS